MLQRSSSRFRGAVSRAIGSNYLRGILSLSSGSFIATGVSIATAPILSRLYTPADYGILAIFMGFTAVFSGLSTWQFEQAIIIEKDEDDAQAVVELCIATTFLTALGALVTVVAFEFARGAYLEELAQWTLFIPALVWASGVNAALEAFASRRQQYRFISRLRVMASLTTAGLSIAYGYFVGGHGGLLLAYCTAGFLPVTTLLWVYRPRIWNFTRPGIRKAFTTAVKHRRFPFFTLPANYAGNLALQVPVYALAAGGFVSLLGQFNRGRQLVMVPFTLLGSAISQVYMRRAAIEYASTGGCRTIFLKTGALLLACGLPPIGLLAALAPSVFRIVLGPDWEAAGDVARILSPMLLLRLICSPLSTTLYVVGAQRADLFLSLTVLTIVASLVGLLYLLALGGTAIVVGYSIGYTIAYALYIAYSLRVSNPPVVTEPRLCGA